VLCLRLAFWTGGDPGRVAELFRRSGLYRPKWDERHYGDGRTYGQVTIEKSLEGATEFYVASDDE
jgi:putative DNA primase/helicase